MSFIPKSPVYALFLDTIERFVIVKRVPVDLDNLIFALISQYHRLFYCDNFIFGNSPSF